MHYVGVNYHRKYSYVVVKSEQGKAERRGIVNNNREEVPAISRALQARQSRSRGNQQLATKNLDYAFIGGGKEVRGR